MGDVKSIFDILQKVGVEQAGALVIYGMVIYYVVKIVPANNQLIANNTEATRATAESQKLIAEALNRLIDRVADHDGNAKSLTVMVATIQQEVSSINATTAKREDVVALGEQVANLGEQVAEMDKTLAKVCVKVGCE